MGATKVAMASPVSPVEQCPSQATRGLAEVQTQRHDGSAPLATVVPAPPPGMTQATVAVPSGVQPGQRLMFTSPDGRRIGVNPLERIEPGTRVTVQFPLAANSHVAGGQGPRGMTEAPPPTTVSVEQLDSQTSTFTWILYGAGWIFVCWSPVTSLVLWALAACMYYAKPVQERTQYHRQRSPARASLFTLAGCCCCACVALMLVAVVSAACGADGSDCDVDFGPGNWTQHRRHHKRHSWNFDFEGNNHDDADDDFDDDEDGPDVDEWHAAPHELTEWGHSMKGAEPPAHEPLLPKGMQAPFQSQTELEESAPSSKSHENQEGRSDPEKKLDNGGEPIVV